MESKENKELDQLVKKMQVVRLWNNLDAQKAFQRVKAKQKRHRMLNIAVVSVAASCIGILFGFSVYKQILSESGIENNLYSQSQGSGVEILYSDGDKYELPVSGLSRACVNSNGDTVYAINTDLIKSKRELSKDRIISLTTPRGKHFNITLSDGTKITLNSATTLKYPEEFKNDSRELVISGEAYFEVAKDQYRPFIVKCRDISVEVLGTVFNINAYDINETIATTLIEGSVNCKVSKDQTIHLLPGEQFVYDTKTTRAFKHEVNVDDYTSWLRNSIVLRRNTLQEIFFRIGAVYDVEITCTERVNQSEKYHIVIQPNEDLDAVLSRLSFIGGMEYNKKNNQILFDRQ